MEKETTFRLLGPAAERWKIKTTDAELQKEVPVIAEEERINMMINLLGATDNNFRKTYPARNKPYKDFTGEKVDPCKALKKLRSRIKSLHTRIIIHDENDSEDPWIDVDADGKYKAYTDYVYDHDSRVWKEGEPEDAIESVTWKDFGMVSALSLTVGVIGFKALSVMALFGSDEFAKKYSISYVCVLCALVLFLSMALGHGVKKILNWSRRWCLPGS